MIPAQAVEAAAREIDAPSEPAAQEIARRALEAAAPYLHTSNTNTNTNQEKAMTEHEELLNVMLEADDAHKAEGAMWPELATAILAAGYRKVSV